MSIFKRKPQKQNLDLEYREGYTGYIESAVRKKKGGRIVLPVAKKIYTKIKKVLQINRNYEIVAPPDTLLTIAKAFKVEGYLRRARDRYVELIWKNGFKFTGSNKSARNYIEKRFIQISKVTGMPTEELFSTISEHLVLYHNCFITKIRNEAASGGRERTTFYGKTLKPIAGYFILEPYRMIAKRDRNNKRIKYWENFNERNTIISRYNVEDIIHITLNKNQTEIFGTPAVVNVLDDIRALRRMEENVEILVFQHAIPLYQYKVGSEEIGPAEGEVEAIQAEIDNMLVQGMLVTDGRHNIEAIGVRGATLDVGPYLEYFRDRIMVGLGQSAQSLGLGQVSRSSMGTVSKLILDAASRFQRRLQSYIESFMIDDLLEEGGFDSFDKDTKVEFFIPEIDLDDRIRREFHITSLWQANLLTEDEARLAIGRDPMSQGEFAKTFFSKITIPKIKEEAKAKASVAAASAKASTTPGVTKSQAQSAMPTNQYGPKRRSGPAKRGTDAEFKSYLSDYSEEYLTIVDNQFGAAADDIEEAMIEGHDNPYDANMDISEKIALEKTSKILISVFEQGLKDSNSSADIYSYSDELRKIHEENTRLLNNLFAEVSDMLKDFSSKYNVGIVFDGVNYKSKLLSSWMVQKTYWLACSLTYKSQGIEEVNIVKNGIAIDLIDLDGVSFESVYPVDYTSLMRSELL